MGKYKNEEAGCLNVGVRLPIKIVKKLDNIAELQGSTRSRVARDVLVEAMLMLELPGDKDKKPSKNTKVYTLEDRIAKLEKLLKAQNRVG